MAAVAMVAANAPTEQAFGRGLVELLIVGTPIASGLYALRCGASTRFAYPLIWIGFAWSLTSLGESPASIPYTIGRMSTWLIFPGVVYLLLAFPNGRISSGLDRVLFAGVIVVSVVLFYGTAPLVPAYPPHTPWATCTTDCPANAVALVDKPPTFLANLILVREWLVMLLWLGLFWSMSRTYRAASPLQRRTTAPVFAAASVLGVLHISFHAARELGAPAQLVTDLSLAWTVAIVAVCAAFMLGLFWHQLLLGRVLAGLGRALRETESPARVRDALAAALDDPSVELLVHDAPAATWRDTSGQVRSWPQPLPTGRAATPISSQAGADDVVLVHDVALRDDQALVDGVVDIVVALRRHGRLEADLERAMSDVEKSRRRIADAAAEERARIERDLHDGAQQRLAALRMRVAQAEDCPQTDPAAARAELGELGLELELAMSELRSFAHGVYPPLLATRGIAAALKGLSAHSPLPIHISDSGVARHPTELESAVYFTCVEAMQNATKHAAGATGVWIQLRESSDALHVEIRDDGIGMPTDADPGRGLQNMHDRIEAVGGRLELKSNPGAGTQLSASVPLAGA